MELNQQETELIQEHLILSHLISDMAAAVKSLEDVKLILKDMVVIATKSFGSGLVERRKGVVKKLQDLRIQTSHDIVGETVFIKVRRGQEREEFMKLKHILVEEADDRFKEILEENAANWVDKPREYRHVPDY